MALTQQKFRETVFQMLHAHEFGHCEPDELIRLVMKELKLSRATVRRAFSRVEEVRGHLKEIDEMIERASESYRFERIGLVERSLLRLAVYEIWYDENIPAKVAISEAIRLTRKFATPESANYVNAILDNIYKQKGSDG